MVMRVFGSGGLAALLLMPARPVSHVLLSVAVVRQVGLPVSVLAFLRPVMIGNISGVAVSRLAERSPRARLTVLRPAACILAASSSGGMMLMLMLMMVRAVTPVTVGTVIRVRGPAVEPG